MEKTNDEKILNDYEKKASLMKKIKYAIIILLVFMILFFLVGYRNDITLENIRYLLKYVDISPAAIGSEKAQVIRLDTESDATYGVFRSDLVVLSRNGLKTYGMNGKEGISAGVSLNSPAFSAADKYFAVYDLGENYFALYNSFSKIYEETTAYPVWKVSISNDGDFLVITAEEGYRSALKVYNSDFENKMNWYTADKYIVSADIHGKRDVVIAAGCVQNNAQGDFLSSVSVLHDGSDKVEASVEYPSELFLDLKFFDNGNLCVLTDCAVRILDMKLKELEKITFSSDSLRMMDVGESYAALVLNENSIGTLHRMIILDDSGNTSMDVEISSDVRDLSVSGNKVLVLGSQALISTDIRKKKQELHAADKSYSEILSLSEDKAILIYDKNAYLVSIE